MVNLESQIDQLRDSLANEKARIIESVRATFNKVSKNHFFQLRKDKQTLKRKLQSLKSNKEKSEAAAKRAKMELKYKIEALCHSEKRLFSLVKVCCSSNALEKRTRLGHSEPSERPRPQVPRPEQGKHAENANSPRRKRLAPDGTGQTQKKLRVVEEQTRRTDFRNRVQQENLSRHGLFVRKGNKATENQN
ncbi:hypothetical protein MHBO_000908 [Bonamia ostreae]|uniref:Uncharacterized protein n=1 Tax=Bonamia ostreae TaxID=126728 RepID=A0ABV2AH78_9EUKA